MNSGLKKYGVWLEYSVKALEGHRTQGVTCTSGTGEEWPCRSAGSWPALSPSLLSFNHLLKTAFCVLFGGSYLTLYQLFLQYFNIKPTRKTTNSRLVLKTWKKITNLFLESVNSSWWIESCGSGNDYFLNNVLKASTFLLKHYELYFCLSL